MKRVVLLLVAIVMTAGFLVFMSPVSGQPDEQVSPIFGVTIPPGYRDWKLISVTHEEGDFNQLRAAHLGTDIAIKAYREGKLPFPDGAIIVALHWKRFPVQEPDGAEQFGGRAVTPTMRVLGSLS